MRCNLSTLVTVVNRSENIHDQISARLRESALVYTAGRRQLVELLLKHGRPASVPELLKNRARLTQSSTYRNLADLEAVGIIHKVAGSDDHARYELNEDLIGHHHHLICDKCGSIDDFEVGSTTERELERVLRSAAKSARFVVTGHRLDAIGVCANCQKNSARTAR